MNARITPFRMNPDEVAAATDTLEQLKTRILALPGMQRFTLVVGTTATAT